MIRSGEDGKIINFHNFFQTKSLLDMDLIFERDPKELHPFDFDTYFASDMTCEIVVTNCESGQAEYYSEKEDGDRLMQLCRASSSMPLVTPMVEIDGVPYLDGGIADSIPLIHSMRSGYRKNRLKTGIQTGSSGRFLSARYRADERTFRGNAGFPGKITEKMERFLQVQACIAKTVRTWENLC